jgi:hypothetical protein
MRHEMWARHVAAIRPNRRFVRAPDDDRSVRRIVDLDARGGKSIQRRKSDVATI